jgi:hypothetical protein
MSGVPSKDLFANGEYEIDPNGTKFIAGEQRPFIIFDISPTDLLQRTCCYQCNSRLDIYQQLCMIKI